MSPIGLYQLISDIYDDEDITCFANSTIAVDVPACHYLNTITGRRCYLSKTFSTKSVAQAILDPQSIRQNLDNFAMLYSLKQFAQNHQIFRQHNITPIYVFDETYPDEKQHVFARRVSRYQDAVKQQHAAKASAICSIQHAKKYYFAFEHIANLDNNALLTVRRVFATRGYAIQQHGEEADKQCARLLRTRAVDHVFSCDYDILVYFPGSPRLIKRIITYEKNYFRTISLQTILNELHITHEQFIEMCILMGVDYNEKIPRIGSKRSYEMIQKHQCIAKMPLSAEQQKQLNVTRVKQIFDLTDLTATIRTAHD
jgi:flap endonuclease-1